MNSKWIILGFLFFANGFVFGQTYPPAPTGLRVTATECGKVSLAWDDYPVEILNTVFEIQRFDNLNNSYRKISTVQSTISNFDDLGANAPLQVGLNYKYRLSASNNSISGVYSNEVTASITDCPEINDLSVSSIECGAIYISWSGLSNAINYTIYRSTTGLNNQFGYYETVTQTSFKDIGSHNYQAFDIEAGQTYYYKIKANFGNLITDFSNTVTASFSCTEPNGLIVTKSSCGAIELKWNDYPTNILEDGYTIARSSDPNGNFYKIGTVAKNITTFIDKDSYLVEGQTYYYKLSGIFYQTLIQSPTVATGSFTCDIPTGLKVTNAECGRIDLAWDDYPVGINETGYELVRYELNGVHSVLASVGANVLNYSITNHSFYSSDFLPNKTYYYKIAGKFFNKTTQFSDPVSASFTCPIPTNLKVTSSNCFVVNLAWDDVPAINSESGYIIYRSYNGYYSQIAEVGANVLTYIDNTYKDAGVTYSYRVAAKFNATQSDASNIVTATIQCAAPSDMEITAASCGEISLKWKNNFTGPLLVFIYRSDNGENGSYNLIHYYQQNLNTYTDKGVQYGPLIEGKTYYYKVYVVKNNITTQFSNVASASFTCVAPTDLIISATSCGEFTLSWPDYPSGINETGYTILRSTSQTDNSFSYLTEVPANTLSYTDNTIYNYFNNYKFYYKIVGKFNSTATQPSNIVTSDYTCPIVQNLKVVGTGCGQIKIAWDALPSNFNVRKYIIYQSQNINSGFYSKGDVVGSTTNYIDNRNLELGTTYYYKVKALINNIETDLGNEVSASFTCQAPTNLQVVSSSCGLINLSWSDYPAGVNENGFRIYRYNPNYYNNYQEIANLPANTLTYTDFGNMEADKPQFYKIQGKFSDTFTDFSADASGSFSCEVPGNLTASSSICGEIVLNWTDFPTTFSESKYIIYRSDNGENGNYYSRGLVEANVLTFLDNYNLSPEKNYFYQIRGQYLNSVTTPSNKVEIQTQCLAPSNFKVASTSCGQITLTWDDYPTGVNETGYLIYRSTNGENGNYDLYATLNANTTTFSDIGANNNEFYVNRIYHYKIYGRFGNTTSNASIIINGSFSCDVPSNLTIVSTNCGAIRLSWDDLPSTVSENGYIIYRSSSTNGNYSQIGTVNANILQYTNFLNLSPGTTYYYKVAAKIGNVASSLSNEVYGSFTCPTPTGLTVTESKCGEISLVWDRTVIASGGYEIYRSDDSNNNNKVLVGTVPFNVYSFVDKGVNNSLTSGLKYYYSVRAKILATLTNFSNTVSTSFSCENPLNLTSTNQTCGTITLAWDDFSSLQETGYEIFRSDFGLNGNYISIGTVNANVLSFVDRGNSQNFYAGREYFYKIKGKLNNNTTSFSNVVAAKFTCPLPQNLVVNSTSCGRIELKWDAVQGSNGVQIFRSETGPNGNFNLLHDLSYTASNTYLDEGAQGRIIVNKIYHYKIRQKLNYTITDFSNITSGSYSCDIPKNLVVSNSSCGEISLKWDDYPSYISENGYYVYRSNYLNGDYSLIGSTNSNILTFTDRGQFGNPLFSGQTYYYKVKGRFINSETLLSDAVSTSFQCDIPQNLTASANSCGKIDLSWVNIPTANGYIIYRSEYEFGNYSNVGNLQTNITSFQDIIYYNLSKKYYYKVSAKYSVNGYSEQSNIASAQTACPTPQNLRIVEVKCGSVKLAWDDIPPEYQETGFVIYRIEKNGSNSQYFNVGRVDPNILTFTDNGSINRGFPGNNTSFSYVIAASFGSYGNSATDYSNEVTTSFDCQTIIIGTVAEAACGKITLNWNTFSSQTINSYAITRSTSLLPADFQPITYLYNEPLNTYTDADFKEAGKTYYYKIYGFVGNIAIEATSIVSASFTCGAAPVLTLVSSECDKVSLAWTDYPTSLSESNFEVTRSENGIDFYYVGRINPNTFTFDDIGYIRPLQSGINYQYRVKGYNFLVKFDPSNIVTTQLNCHSAPVLSLVNTECGQINLNWSDYSGALNEDSYILYRAIDGDDYFYPISPINNTNFTDRGGLKANQKYNYKVAGKFGNMISPFSNIVTAQFSCENNLLITASATSCNTIQLNWTADPNQGKNYFYYRIYRSETGLNGNYQEFASGTGNNNLIDQFNIEAGKTYHYKIKTEYNGLLSDFSLPASVTVGCQGYTQSPPQNLHSPTQTCSKITLNWDDFPAGVTEESYEIHRSTDNVSFTLIASPAANSTEFVDQNLAQNTIYYYKIRGRFSAGFSDFTEVISPKTNCVAVANFGVNAETCTSISLTWSDLGAINTEESYELHRSTDGNNYEMIAHIDANATSYSDKNLALNTTYYYKIRGRFGAGYTPFTVPIIAKTACAGPTNFVANPQNCTQILLTWSDLGPTNTEESYELYRSTTGLENSYEFITKIDANSTQFLDQSLPTNQQFWYLLRGRFGTGFSPYSAIATAKTVPITLILKEKASSAVTLGWNICSSDRENWVIFMSTDGKNLTEIKREEALIEFSKIEYLTPGQTYYFWLSPILRTGYGNLSNMITVTLPAFPRPTNLVSKAVTDSTFSLEWQDNSNGPDHEESWELMLQTADNKWVTIDKIDANKIKFTVDSLKSDTTYCLAIRARHSMGFSEISNIICVKTDKKATLSTTKQSDIVNKNARIFTENSDYSEAESIKIYPNPAQKYIIIKGYFGKRTDSEISIINSLGQIIKSETIHFLPNQGEHSINIERITNGTYFLKINQLGKEKLLKFVKWE